MDMDFARRVAAREAATGQAATLDSDGPTPLRYGPVEQRLDSVIEWLQALRSTFVAVNTDKQHANQVPKVQPARRPKTALAKAREELELAELADLGRAVLGAGLPLN